MNDSRLFLGGGRGGFAYVCTLDVAISFQCNTLIMSNIVAFFKLPSSLKQESVSLTVRFMGEKNGAMRFLYSLAVLQWMLKHQIIVVVSPL